MFGVDDAIIMGIGAAIAAAGAGASIYGANKQAKKANAAANSALLAQAKQREDIEDKVLELANTYDANKRNNDYQTTSQNLATQYEKPVIADQVKRAQYQGVTGNVSNDYVKAKALSDADNLAFAKNYSSLLSKANANKRMRQNQQYLYQRYANDINQMSRFNKMDNNLANMRINSIENSQNGWQVAGGPLMALGSMMMTAGAAGMAGAGAGNLGTGLVGGEAAPGTASVGAGAGNLGLNGWTPGFLATNASSGMASSLAPSVTLSGTTPTFLGDTAFNLASNANNSHNLLMALGASTAGLGGSSFGGKIR